MNFDLLFALIGDDEEFVGSVVIDGDLVENDGVVDNDSDLSESAEV